MCSFPFPNGLYLFEVAQDSSVLCFVSQIELLVEDCDAMKAEIDEKSEIMQKTAEEEERLRQQINEQHLNYEDKAQVC